MLKNIKLISITLIALFFTAFIVNFMLKDEVGNVSLGMFTTNDIKLNMMVDPIVTGVTCHVASIEANLSLSDPSDSSISCRQTGEITIEMIDQIDKSKSGDVVFKKSKSIFFKNMKIRRIYDPMNQTLMYLSYSTKETSGSYRHSLSTVPLWSSKAFKINTAASKH